MQNRLRSISPRERALYLKTLPFARDLGTDAIMMAALQMRECQFRAGEYLLTQNEPIEGLYIITSGTVALSQDDSPVDQLEAPARVGLIGLLAGEVAGGPDGAPGNIVAQTHVEALELPADLVDHLLGASFEFLFGLTRWIAQQLLDEPPEKQMLTFCCASGDGLDDGISLFDRLLWLQKSPLFGPANLEAVLELARHQSVVRADVDDILWQPGDSANTILSVVQGSIEISSTTDHSRATQREFVGLLEALAGQTHNGRARVAEPLVALALDFDVLLEVLEDHIDMAIQMMRRLAAIAVRRRWRKTCADQSGADFVRSRNASASTVEDRPMDTID